MTRSVFISMIICLSALRVDAQLPLKTVVQKYNSFKSALPPARLHFVLNQERYAPGDTIFFKTYFFKDGLQPVSSRQLIDFNLLASGGQTVRHFLCTTSNGVGANQVILPDTLAPGIYMMAAYSSWMKNYGSPPIFTKEITVVGERAIERKGDAGALKNMRVRVDRETSKINIAAPDGSLLRYQSMYLIVVNNHRITLTRSFTQGTRSMVSIDAANAFLPGLNILHVLDKVGRPVGTGSFFIPAARPVNVSIATPERLQRRKKGNITISLSDDNNKPVQGEFSVKILNAVLADSTQKSFEHELALSTPLNESWHQLLYERIRNPKYDFTTDLSRKGTVYMPDGVTPAAERTRVFFYLQDNDVMMQSLTSQGGKIKLSVPDVFGTDDLFYMAEYFDEEVPGMKIVWEGESIPLPAPPPFNETSDGDPYGIFAANKKMIDKAFDFDNSAAPAIPIDVPRAESDLEGRLQGPDITIKIDDYVAFPTIHEMIREIVPALKVRKVRGKEIVQIGLQQGVPESGPLYIIDGIATKDSDFFLSLKPADLLTIKLVTNPAKLSTLGLMSRSGIVIVETKSGNVRQTTDPSRIVDGINKAITFKQPAHDNMRRPDFRSTIYWNPIVKTDWNGKAVVEFECSDDLNTVNVRIDGITVDGRPFSGTAALNFVLSNN